MTPVILTQTMAIPNLATFLSLVFSIVNTITKEF